MTPRPLRELPTDRLHEAVALHQATIDGLLPRLGPWFLQRYYEDAVADSDRLGFFVEDGTVAGLVVGSPRPDADFAALMNPLPSFIGQLAGAVLARPGLLPQLVSSWWGVSGAAELRPDEVELTYLMVAPSHHRQGLGRALTERFCEAAAEQGHRGVVLSVEQDIPAVRFYERLGFEVRDRIVEGRFERLRMVRSC